MVESGRVPGKSRIRASVEKLSGRVSERSRISESIKKMVESGREVKGRIRASIEKLSGEYRKRVELVRVSNNGRIRASAGKR